MRDTFVKSKFPSYKGDSRSWEITVQSEWQSPAQSSRQDP